MVIAAAFAGVVAVVGPVRPAVAFLDFFVFDPYALAQHVRQVAQVAEQVRQAARQVQGGLRELEHLGPAAAPDVATTVATLAKEFDAAVYRAASPSDQLATQYPTDLSGVAADRYAAERAGWVDAERASLAENRRLQNAVEQDMAVTGDRVQRIVVASNAGGGETAAAQAHLDLLAVASGEVAKLQALRAARSRLRTEELALGQSEGAYGDAQRSAVRGGWDAPPQPAGGMVPAFGE